jgi:hypothetical protein
MIPLMMRCEESVVWLTVGWVTFHALNDWEEFLLDWVRNDDGCFWKDSKTCG